MLNALRERGSWYQGCGIMWTSYKQTTKIMDTLVARGLAVVEGGKYYPRLADATEVSSISELMTGVRK